MTYYEAQNTTMEELQIYIEADQLRKYNEERKMYLEAWLNDVVSSKKKDGKKEVRVYKKFEDFFTNNKIDYNYTNEELAHKKNLHKKDNLLIKFLKQKEYNKNKNLKSR